MLSYLFCQTTNFKRHLSIHGIKSKLTAVLLPPRRGAEGEKASADGGGRAEGAPPYHLLAPGRGLKSTPIPPRLTWL